MPRFEDLEWCGLAFTREQFDEAQRIDRAAWRAEFLGHTELFLTLHDRMPPVLIYERELLVSRM
jgi:phosphoenolpyruvate carboxykinase (GTP)